MHPLPDFSDEQFAMFIVLVVVAFFKEKFESYKAIFKGPSMRCGCLKKRIVGCLRQ